MAAKVKPAVKKSAALKPPLQGEVEALLGPAAVFWREVSDAVAAVYAPLEAEWRPAKRLILGHYFILRHKDRTLVYLLPEAGNLVVNVVLGEKAVAAVLKSSLRADLKQLLRNAQAYAEGRSLRFAVRTQADIEALLQLIAFKLAKE